MTAWISALSICVTALLTCFPVTAQEGRLRSLPVLDQSDLRGPFCHWVFSGRGIHIEKLNDVFDPFFTNKMRGMGIDLSIPRTVSAVSLILGGSLARGCAYC
jgi:phosphoglycerate-specific signal transduction histidine kinase